jgi:DNA-binding CsgD family transcriptional regulator
LKLKAFFLFLLGCFVITITFGQTAEISGKVQLPTGWARNVYVCHIPDFNLMYQASDALLIAQGTIDSTGNFKVKFPSNSREAFFRIQFIKTGDPRSTIIIGSREGNHAFFIAKNSDRVFFESVNNNQMISQGCVKGGRSNQELNALLNWVQVDSVSRNSIKEGLIQIEKKSTSEVVALLAVHLTFGLSDKQRDEVAKTLSKFDQGNPYGVRIYNEYKKNVPLWNYIVLILCATVVFIIPLSIYRYKNWRLIKTLHSLSPRERNIIEFVITGKSNKEIAAALNIELSTVKTHVNNAYSKLKIRDRKELAKYRKHVAPDKMEPQPEKI